LKWHKLYTTHIDKYSYDDTLYPDSFLSRNIKDLSDSLSSAPEVIYVFWTGENELTPNRIIGLNSLIERSNVEVCLITPKNLNEYILDSHPLHGSYKYLSLIQKSDYLRCYFMLHYGGGYADIKPCLNSWKELFKKLNSTDYWCLGKSEKYSGGVPPVGGTLQRDCMKYHNYLISNGGFIYKPNSRIAKEWMDEIHIRLDYFSADLINNPGDAFGSGNYPIPWAYLAGHIMSPLVLKYHEKVLKLDIKLFSNTNYR
jgi:hypothetical protein